MLGERFGSIMYERTNAFANYFRLKVETRALYLESLS